MKNIVKKYKLLFGIIFTFIVCFILSSYILFNTNHSVNGTNYTFHLLRIKGIWWSIENNIFPHRINALANNFYGDADPIGYPYLFLYLPAFLLKYINYELAYNIYVFIVNIFTFIVMYISSKMIFKNNFSAIISSVLWTLSNYRLFDIYDFCRMGEYTALIFYPLAIASIYNIFFDDRKKWYFLIIAMTGAMQSHIISFFYLFLMVVFLFVTSFVINLVYSIKNKNYDDIKNNLICFFKAGIISILINLWFIVPFLQYYFEDTLYFSNMGESTLSNTVLSLDGLQFSHDSESSLSIFIQDIAEKLNNFLILILNCIFFLFRIIDKTHIDDDGDNNSFMIANFSFTDKIVIILIFFIIIYVVFKRFVCNKNKDLKTIDKQSIIAFVFFIIYIYYYLASICYFPFQTNESSILFHIYSKQQFSFRELGRGLPFLYLSFGYLFSNIKINKIFLYFIVIIISSMSAFLYLNTKVLSVFTENNLMKNTQSLSDYQFNLKEKFQEDEDSFVNIYDKYKTFLIYDNVFSTSNHIKVIDYRQGYLSIYLNYEYSDFPIENNLYKDENKMLYVEENSSLYDKWNNNLIECIDKTYIELPMLAYTGFECYDQDNNKLNVYRNIDGKAIIEINDLNGHIFFKFHNPKLWIYTSFISYILILFFILKRGVYEFGNVKKYLKEERCFDEKVV